MAKQAKKCVKCSKPSYCSGFCRQHFMNYFEKKILRTIHQFKLFSKQENVAVAASGGKDSTTCFYVLKKLGYNIEAVTIDVMIGKYSDTNLKNVRKSCADYGVKLHEISFGQEYGMSLRDILKKVRQKETGYSSCFVCGVLRRHLLNKFLKQHSFACVCTGHNLDDEAQAFVMNIFRNDLGLASRQGPITGAGGSKGFVKRAKPLFMCSESEVEAYSKMMKFPVNYSSCPEREGAYRKEYADMLDSFEKRHPHVKYNIISFFLKAFYETRSKHPGIFADKNPVGECQCCGEPCSKDVCKRCEILTKIRGVGDDKKTISR